MQFDSTQLSVSQFMAEWLMSVKPALRTNTHLQYSQVATQHILPHIGQGKLRDLTANHAQRLYNRMVSEGKGLRTVRLTHAVLHRSMAYAVKLGLISRNPATATTPPKYVQEEMQILDENQAQQLLVVSKSIQERFFALYHLALSTGMRQGELLGLKWTDLDVQHGVLQVQRQLTRGADGKLVFCAPKTKSGVRRVDLGSRTVSILLEHKKLQDGERKTAKSAWQENDLMFPSEEGTPMNRNNLGKMFKRLIKTARLPEVRFHDLRHTGASLMLNNGVPVIVVSKRLGHAKPSITLDVYGHLVPNKQQEVANLMDELLTPIEFPIAR